MADRLREYRAKRVTPTPEPDGAGVAEAGERRRFVVQEHHATRLHWDLRLERDGVAVSWAIPNGIPDDPGENRLAVHTEDHPLSYLDFEGDIPKGSYGAGRMRIWDHGTYDAHEFTDAKVEVTFHGERLSGRYGLFPLRKRRHEPAGKDWMIHRMDPPADPGAGPLPEHVAPMLAKAGPLPADADRWAYEIKWDGVRAIATSEPGRLRLASRNGNDVSVAYPELRALNRALGSHRAILDGEIVALDAEGRPSFARLQRRMHVASDSAARRRAKETPVVYMVFDLLWLDGHALTGLPYAERRERLFALELGDGAAWRVPEALDGDAAAVLEATRANGLEGIVAKRRDSAYEPGRRSSCWIKARNMRTLDVVIGGWMPGEGRRRERIGALLVGVLQDGGLRYAGRVGTGFGEAELDELRAMLDPREDSPFAGPVAQAAGAVWVQPERVAEVRFSEWTPDRLLRQPSYLGLREEAPASALVDAGQPVRGGVELAVAGRRLKLANPDKVLYPATGFAKRDLVEYLAAIAPVLLGHLRDRPLTRKRYPDGVEGQAFFEKQCPAHRPDWVATAPVTLSSKTVEFCLAQDLPTLVWLGNLAALELHASLARAGHPERPDVLVFDLDPGPPATVVECCRVATWLEGMFSELGLTSRAKTSGSKGLQVYVPLNEPSVTYDATKAFARAVAELLAASEPELVVARMSREARPGRVFIDWSQNDEHKTTVSVYSLRARERPTVSTPVTWEEVRACRDGGDPGALVFEAHDVLARVADQGDLFADVLGLSQRLPALG